MRLRTHVRQKRIEQVLIAILVLAVIVITTFLINREMSRAIHSDDLSLSHQSSSQISAHAATDRH